MGDALKLRHVEARYCDVQVRSYFFMSVIAFVMLEGILAAVSAPYDAMHIELAFVLTLPIHLHAALPQ